MRSLRWKKQVHTRWMLIYNKQNQGDPNMAVRIEASNGEEVVKEVSIQLIPVKINLEGKAMSPMQRIIETCNVK